MQEGILDVYVCLLSSGQSERVLKHTLASLRVFISRFAKVLFSAEAATEAVQARICMAALRISNLDLLPQRQRPGEKTAEDVGGVLEAPSRRCTTLEPQPTSSAVGALRLEACGLLYRLWRGSYEVFGSRGFKRVHLQTIVSLSKLVGDIGPEFETSLSLLHSLAEADLRRGGGASGAGAGVDAEAFMQGLEDLIRRIRGVLTATEEMRSYGNDPQRKIDLQYSLAKSYASNPVLRR